MSSKPLSLRRRIAFLSVMLALVISAQEIVARLIFPMPEVLGFNRIHYSPVDWETKAPGIPKRGTLTNASLHWHSEPDGMSFVHTLNLYGFRDRQWRVEKTGKPRVLFVGDSFTEGNMAADNQTMARVFEGLANQTGMSWEVLNPGVSAANLERYTRLIKDAAGLFQPEALILVLYANDFAEIRPHADYLRLWPTSMSNDFSKNNPWTPRIWQVVKRLLEGATVSRAWSSAPVQFFAPVPSPANPWTEHETEYSEFVKEPFASAMKRGTFDPWLANRLNLVAHAYQSVDEDLDDYIVDIHNNALQAGFALSIVYLPDALMTSDYYIPYQRDFSRGSAVVSLMGPAYEVQAHHLGELTTRLSIPFLVLTAALRQQEAKDRHMYWEYDAHMRAKGYAFCAEQIFQWWRENNRVALN